MKKLTNKKDIHRLTLLFAAAYMISYITRINYGAIIAEMENTTGFTRSMLSMALTGSFFTYVPDKSSVEYAETGFRQRNWFPAALR